MDDPRPILPCPVCECDVVTLPNGKCHWCDTQITKPPQSQTLLLHLDRVA